MAPKKQEPKKSVSPDSSDNELDKLDQYNIGMLEQRYNDKGLPLLIRELGLRMLYHKSVSDHYHLYKRAERYMSYDESTIEIAKIGGDRTAKENTDFTHKWFSFVRFHHRSDKRMHRDDGMKSTGNERSDHTLKVRFPGEHEVSETTVMGNIKNGKYYKDSRYQWLSYSDSDSDGSYKDINLNIKVFNNKNPGIVQRLKENFKKILHGYEAQGSSEEVQFTYNLFYHLFGVETDRDPGSFIMIPMALELWEQSELDIVDKGGLIPICFFEAMQILAHLKHLGTSLEYGYDYGSYIDPKHYKTFVESTSKTLKAWLKRGDIPPFEELLDQLYCLCGRWYGFTPTIPEDGVKAGQIDVTFIKRAFEKLFSQLQDNKPHLRPPSGFVDVEGDGHCFYHAIAHQLSNAKSSEELQQMALDHILQYPMDYIYFLSGFNEVPDVQRLTAHGNYQGALQAYIEHHLQANTWADNLMMQALSNALGMSITVHMFDQHQTPQIHTAGQYAGQNVVLSIHPFYNIPIKSPNALVIGNIADTHFVSADQVALSATEEVFDTAGAEVEAIVTTAAEGEAPPIPVEDEQAAAIAAISAPPSYGGLCIL